MKIDTSNLFDEVMKEIDKNMKNDGKKIIDIEKYETDDEYYYDESLLSENLSDDFYDQIRDRGERYYYDGNVLSVYKNNNKYIAKVKGNSDKPYEVVIEVFDDFDATYECSCPCEYPCKHEYAVIMAITNGDYSEIELKTPVREKEANLKKIIQDIPAEELKSFMLSPNVVDNIILPLEAFSEHFRKYYPKQTYEYYYNNLYNEFVIDGDYVKMINQYIDLSSEYLVSNDFNESFKIVKSIIDAYSDTNRLNFDDYVFEVINKLGMILRITYRKSNDALRKEINEWKDKLEKENYYNNYYLEDLIICLN